MAAAPEEAFHASEQLSLEQANGYVSAFNKFYDMIKANDWLDFNVHTDTRTTIETVLQGFDPEIATFTADEIVIHFKSLVELGQKAAFADGFRTNTIQLEDDTKSSADDKFFLLFENHEAVNCYLAPLFLVVFQTLNAPGFNRAQQLGLFLVIGKAERYLYEAFLGSKSYHPTPLSKEDIINIALGAYRTDPNRPTVEDLTAWKLAGTHNMDFELRCLQNGHGTVAGAYWAYASCFAEGCPDYLFERTLWVLRDKMTAAASPELQEAMIDQVLLFYTQNLVYFSNFQADYVRDRQEILRNGQIHEKITAILQVGSTLPRVDGNIDNFIAEIWAPMLSRI